MTRSTDVGDLRVGISGHRRIADPKPLRSLIEEAIDGLLAATGHADLALWSSLAEGADRIGAQVVLDRRAKVHVVLPLPIDEYERDFPESVAEFEHLIARAATVEIAPEGLTREDAYLAAGVGVLDATEALIAVWSGRPARGRGGTAEIVSEARRRGHALAWIRADNGPDEPAQPGPAIAYEGLREEPL